MAAAALFACGGSSAPGGGSNGPPPESPPAAADAGSPDAGTAHAGGTPDAGSAAPRRTLHLHVVNPGVVYVGAVSCTFRCDLEFDDGTAVHLTAESRDQQFGFAGWTGDCAGGGACDLVMNQDRDATANFDFVASVKVMINGEGRVISSPAAIDCSSACSSVVPLGMSLSLTAIAAPGYVFRGWGGPCEASGATCNIALIGSGTWWANFEPAAPAPQLCEGIAAPVPTAPVQFLRMPDYDLPFQCGNATTDSSGVVAFVINGAHGDGIDFRDPSGAARRPASGAVQFLDMDGYLLPQPTGFIHLSGRPYLGPEWAIEHGQELASFDPMGTGTGARLFGNFSQQWLLPAAADPNGGVLIAGDLSTGELAPTVHGAMMIDGGGTSAQLRWGPRTLASPGAVIGVGVDVLGRALVITDGSSRFGAGAVSAEWFEADGTSRTGEFLLLAKFVPGPSTWFETSALIGGGLLVRRVDGLSHAQALVVLASGGVVPRAAPVWMTSRPDVRLQIARGGKAYATLPLGAPGVPCTQRVELLAADGTFCGAVDYPMAGGTCDTHDLNLGADGTVLQNLGSSLEVSSLSVGGHTCSLRFWPAALR